MIEMYFDESGNTGANFMDINQPYFVYGGWMVKKHMVSTINKEIDIVFLSSNAKEIKSKKGLKYDKCKELFHKMYEIGAVPVFGVVDKKYMIAAKIVETFFDHIYNPNVNGYLTYRTELKKSLADNLYENKNLLNEFSGLIRNGTIELVKMREIKRLLELHFENEGLLDVKGTISNLSDSNLQEMIEEFETISQNGKRWLSLVMPILIDRMLHVDKYLELIHEDAILYVDELWGYQDVFDELNKILMKKRIIKNVAFGGQKESDQTKLIQAADYLCGFIYHTLLDKEKIENNSSIVNELWQDFVFFDYTFKKYGIKIWDYYANSYFEYEILKLAGYTGENKNIDSKMVIKRDFALALK